MGIQTLKLDTNKQRKIFNYLKTQKQLPIRGRFPWRGDNLVDFKVYKIPTGLLSYNFYNTRIRSELVGYLHKKGELNPNDAKQKEKVHSILLKSKWFGAVATTRLMNDLQNRGQLDPAIARPDGILIDGNRRLAILREIEKKLKHAELKSDDFSKMYVCFLPNDSSFDDLKELEMRIQMTQPFRVKYRDINTALEFRYLHQDLKWDIKYIEEITKKYYKEKKIRNMIRIINLIDECLKLLPPQGEFEKQYTKLDKGWEGFANLDSIIQWAEKDKPDKIEWQKNIKYLGFQIISSTDTTYADIRKLKNVLKMPSACDVIEDISPTLNGHNKFNLLEKSKIAEEIDCLKHAYAVYIDEHDSPYKRASDALKKLESIKIRNTIYSDPKLLTIIDKIDKKLNEIRGKFP